MNKVLAVVVIALIAVGGAAAFVITNNKSETNDPPQVSDTQAVDQPAQTTNGQNAQTTEPINDNKVTIRNQAYSPSKITVKVGTAVTWINEDSVQHDISPDEDYGDAFIASELLSRSESYSFTFNKAGTYTYHCTPHPFMKGTVEVTE